MIARSLTLAEFEKELGRLPSELEDAIVRGLRSASQRGVGVMVEAIVTSKPFPAVDTGFLARSVESQNVPGGGVIVVDAPHAAVIDNGARPFWPPAAPLIEWANRKFGLDDVEARRVAFAVRKKISREGIAPRHFSRTAMATIRKIIPIEVESELSKV